MSKPQTIILVILLMLPVSMNSQFIINEFSASNSSLIADPDFNDYSDWIELYNASKTPENLKGFYITDNLNNLDKFQITTDTLIQPGGYVLIWMDNMGDGLHAGFKLSQEGESIGIVDVAGNIVDSLTYPAQVSDITMGRVQPDSEEWVYFIQATPGATNNIEHYTGVLFNIPEFTRLGGIFNDSQQVGIHSLLGGTIRFTTDGSEPTDTSPIYQDPINITQTTVVRARIFKDGYIPGRIVTHTYFINEDLVNRDLPVVSIATNPENFWDADLGIYVQDFKPDWEVPINIEMFENNGSDRALFNLPAGTKVNGLYSWQLPQKMLGVYFRKKYGENKLSAQLFLEKPRINFDDFALRASGSDWSYTLFRDVLGQSAAANKADVDYMAYRACIVYVNGEYLGIHNIREKVNKDYIVGNFGMKSGSFDLIENEKLVEEGSIDAYKKFQALKNKDLSKQSDFDTVLKYIDIDNFTDMVITEMATGNSSIDHNVMCWKPIDSGKWRWILMDLDRGFFNPTSYDIKFILDRSVLPFADLMKNVGYKQYFGQKLADHLYVTFNPLRMNGLIDKHSKNIENEIANHIDRWYGTTSSYGNAMPSVDYWNNQVGNLRNFVNNRPAFLLEDLTKYGFKTSATLNLDVYPPDAGNIQLNGLDIPKANWNGLYPINMTIALSAIDKPGYDFVGWQSPDLKIIATGEEWKYFNSNTSPGADWNTAGFDDSGWSTGNAEFGYGDNDEDTELSYGGNSSNKYISYYFRKTFQLTGNQLDSTFVLNLIRDDGAVVYINGQEVVRSNMPTGTIDYSTTASVAVGGSDESSFYEYNIPVAYFNEGVNTIAVEVHQINQTSSDISFNLELSTKIATPTNYFSTDNSISLEITGATSVTAVYESTGDCLIPDTIAQNTVLTSECSPYLVHENVFIPNGVTLSIEPGVEVRMPENGNFFVEGKLEAIGTQQQKILFTANPEYGNTAWGALNFINSVDTSVMKYVTIEGASNGPKYYHADAAISSYSANLILDQLLITTVNSNPIVARYSYVSLTNSTLHSKVTGDFINVKYGKAFIRGCTFEGNKMPDTDAIDFDGVEDGVITDCKIYNFFGANSDAIDIGERAKNVRIDSVFIYNVIDKGISVGQHSSANVSHSTFVNCNQGFGLKDSCLVHINHCTFYNSITPIACFEKNIGYAGGNAIVSNSILSNSVEQSFFCDSKSTLSISNSISDNLVLPIGENNLLVDPSFVNPTNHDFRLNNETVFSSELGSVPGSYFHKYRGDRDLIISGIYYNTKGSIDQSEFLMIYNPDSNAMDISGFKVSEAIQCEIPNGTIIGPHDIIYLVGDTITTPVRSYSRNVVQWQNGRLSNTGEKILLHNAYGIVVDVVEYLSDGEWPNVTSDELIELIEPDVDNHFGKNWLVKNYKNNINLNSNTKNQEILVYPNPAITHINIELSTHPEAKVYIYNLAGVAVKYDQLDVFGTGRIDIENLEPGIYILKIDNLSTKITVF